MSTTEAPTTLRIPALQSVYDQLAWLSWPIVRIAAGLFLMPHGAQKLLGWFGGYGFAGTLGFLTEKVGLPKPLAASVILIEFAAPLLLAAGLGTRFAALGIGAIMIGAIATVHASQGFFMNWSGAQAGEGFEYHLLTLGLVAVLLAQGGGRLSLDRRLGVSPDPSRG